MGSRSGRVKISARQKRLNTIVRGIKTAREMLDVIDTFMVRKADGGEGRNLAAVLSAVRGPDSQSTKSIRLKEATTGVIRYAAFPRSCWHFGVANTDSEEAAKTRRQCHIVNDHFRQHARDAFDALGLKWDVEND